MSRNFYKYFAVGMTLVESQWLLPCVLVLSSLCRLSPLLLSESCYMFSNFKTLIIIKWTIYRRHIRIDLWTLDDSLEVCVHRYLWKLMHSIFLKKSNSSYISKDYCYSKCIAVHWSNKGIYNKLCNAIYLGGKPFKTNITINS